MNSRHIKPIVRVVTVMMLVGLTLGAMLPAYAARSDLTRVSVDSSGAQANGASRNSQLSADGRYVVFESFAINVVPMIRITWKISL